MKTTRYFDEQVLRKRPYIDPAWCVDVVAGPLWRDTQPDGRVRFRGELETRGGRAPRVLRVVTLAERQSTNAFFDRGFLRDSS